MVCLTLENRIIRYNFLIGFDVSGTNVLIEDSNIFNGDDCVAGLYLNYRLNIFPLTSFHGQLITERKTLLYDV